MLGRLVELGEASRRDTGLLARPVRVLVPSSSLRLHLCDRIVRAGVGAPRAMLGVTVQPLLALAGEILERSGEVVRGGDARIELLALRFARREASLREAYGAFEDGFGAALASVRDLLDAGFEADFSEALQERLDDTPLTREERRRAKALVRVAAEVAGQSLPGGMEEMTIGGRSALLAAARRAFLADPERALPTRMLLVHGFADATGRALDLLEALSRNLPTEVFVDHPPDSLGGDAADPASRFVEPIEARLLGGSGEREELPPAEPPSPATFFLATSPTAEALEIARRIRGLLDDGERPEEIGVVLRASDVYLLPLRRAFDELAIPFSTLGLAGLADAAGRRLLALAALLTELEEVGVERWLDALGQEAASALPLLFEVRLQLRAQSITRFGALVPREKKTSPAEGIHGLALATKNALDELPPSASLSAYLEAFTHLRRDALGWSPESEAEERVRGVERALREGLADASLERDEFLHFCAGALRSAAPARVGGAGAGVQVLDTTESRGRTFAHLFVAGCNRGAFPRPVQEDLAFPDEVRMPLTELLPDLPIKARARLEDRYLFATLLAASPAVTLSWRTADEDGKAQVVSPFIERLLGDRATESVPRAPGPHSTEPSPACASTLRGTRQRATIACLEDGRPALAHALPAIFSSSGMDAREAASLSEVRIALVRAFEAGPRSPQLLAPWLGFLGPPSEDLALPNLRAAPDEAPHVTTIEAVARCAWQAMIRKVLDLEEEPDPLAELPSLNPRELGSVVHMVLQGIDEPAVGPEGLPLEEVIERTPAPTPWPPPATLERLLLKASGKVLGARLERFPLLERIFAAGARPFLETAAAIRELERGDGALGAEVSGMARTETPEGDALRVRFRADRVERIAGRLVLTDYKTGSLPDSGQRPRSLLPKGTMLQGMAYALASVDIGDPGEGRYLYLKGDPEDPATRQAFDTADDAFAGETAAFANALQAIQGSLEGGVMFPRLLDAKKTGQPGGCKHCEARAACLTDDSTARRTLLAWVEEAGLGGEDGERLRELFALSGRTIAKKPRKGSKGGKKS